jgi:hypothetical protein
MVADPVTARRAWIGAASDDERSPKKSIVSLCLTCGLIKVLESN